MIWAWIENVEGADRSSATIRSGLTASARANPDPLALAAAELVRVALDEVGVQPDGRHELADPLAALLAVADIVDVEGLTDDSTRRHPRIEARIRVLEDHLHRRLMRRSSDPLRPPGRPRRR